MGISRPKIRVARVADLDALVRLEALGFVTEQFGRAQLHYLLVKAHATTLVLEIERQVAGSAIMVWRRGSTAGRLYSIVIDPQFHGRGYGRLLLRACETAARKNACQRVTLEVRVGNTAAVSLYRSAGYRVMGTIEGYYPDGANALKMEKTLATVARQTTRTTK